MIAHIVQTGQETVRHRCDHPMSMRTFKDKSMELIKPLLRLIELGQGLGTTYIGSKLVRGDKLPEVYMRE